LSQSNIVKFLDNDSIAWWNASTSQRAGCPVMVSFVHRAPYVVGLGGNVNASSTTDNALRLALQVAAAAGAETMLLSGSDLQLPMYTAEGHERTPAARRLVEELRKADGIIIGSPSYHGSVSGYVKNALDYAEDLRGEAAPYFEGRAVGCIAVAGGWPAAMSTLNTLRSVVHALRGWPTPLGVPIVTSQPTFDPKGACLVSRIQEQIEIMTRQVFEFASWRAATATATATATTARVTHAGAVPVLLSEQRHNC
jgi:FMN reductase